MFDRRWMVAVLAASLTCSGCFEPPTKPPPPTSSFATLPPPMHFVCTDPTTAERFDADIAIDGAVTRNGKQVAEILDDRVNKVAPNGPPVTLVKLREDGTLETGDDARWRLTDDDALEIEKNGVVARVAIDDAGWIRTTPRDETLAKCRFDRFTPDRRRTAALAVAGGIVALRGEIAALIVKGLGEAYGVEAAPH